MIIEYDGEANAVYITLREGAVARTEEVSENLNVDVDANGQPIGIEILDARELIGIESLGHVTLTNLLTEPVVS